MSKCLTLFILIYKLICHSCCDLASAMFFCPVNGQTPAFWQLTVYQFRPTRYLRVCHGDIDSTLTGHRMIQQPPINIVSVSKYCIVKYWCDRARDSTVASNLSKQFCQFDTPSHVENTAENHFICPSNLPTPDHSFVEVFFHVVFTIQRIIFTISLWKITFLLHVLFFVPGNMPGNSYRFDGSKNTARIPTAPQLVPCHCSA